MSCPWHEQQNKGTKGQQEKILLCVTLWEMWTIPFTITVDTLWVDCWKWKVQIYFLLLALNKRCLLSLESWQWLAADVSMSCLLLQISSQAAWTMLVVVCIATYLNRRKSCRMFWCTCCFVHVNVGYTVDFFAMRLFFLLFWNKERIVTFLFFPKWGK